MYAEMQESVTEQMMLEPEIEREGKPLEFRLVYEGQLPAATGSNTRVAWKHQIRRAFHKQLKPFWSIHPELRSRQDNLSADVRDAGFIDRELPRYQIGQNHFLPLLTDLRGLACSLDILFLRREAPGRVLNNYGDIDNRLKTLFDALRVPQNNGEIPKDWVQEGDELPLYCLLSDDALITNISVTTDRLLTPDGNASDVMLIIHVRSIITDFGKAPWGFLAV